MFIKELHVSNFRGKNGILQFSKDKPNLLIGHNGSGKSIVLDIIDCLTNPNPSRWTFEASFEKITIVVSVDDKLITETFTGPALNMTQLTEFQSKLGSNASLAFDSGVYIRTDWQFWNTIGRKKQLAITNALCKLDMELSPELMDYELGGGGTTVAQVYAGVDPSQSGPILMDHPERSLHVMAKSQWLKIIMTDNYLCGRRRQLICTAHNPEFLGDTLRQYDKSSNLLDTDSLMNFPSLKDAELYRISSLLE